MNEEVKQKKVFYKTWYGITLIVLCLIIVMGNLGGSKEKANTVSTTPAPGIATTVSEPSMSKDQAQKELSDLMVLSQTAGLVTTYEFSNSALVVYVGSVWYTQKVQFKKDFIAKIGLLKKAITGYTHFEVRDAYTNEKVGEITSFSQSIEVYK